MNKSKEKVKENPIVTDRAIRMANPCHRIDKVVPGQCKNLRGKFINCYLCLQIHSLWS